METVVLYDANCHEINNYVAGVQEPFGIVTLAGRAEARKYWLADALKVIDLVERTSKGHFALRYEFI